MSRSPKRGRNGDDGIAEEKRSGGGGSSLTQHETLGGGSGRLTRKHASKGGRRKLIGLELFTSEATYAILIFVYATFGFSIYAVFRLLTTTSHQPYGTTTTFPDSQDPAIARDELVAAANFAPYFNGYQNGSIIDFDAKVVATGDEIEITDLNGSPYVALQLISVTESDSRLSSFDIKGVFINEDGIDLNGVERIKLEVNAQGCLRGHDCSGGQNWGVIADPTRTKISSQLHATAHNAEGVPTRVEWFVYSFIQLSFYPSPVSALTWQVRYLTDPNNAIFVLNSGGGFGSCPADDGSCLFLNVAWQFQSHWDSRYFYSATLVLVVVMLSTFWYLLHKERKRTGTPLLSMQIWLLWFCVGVLLYQNPVQTVSDWMLTSSQPPNQVLLYFQDKITLIGITFILFAIICMADAPRRMTTNRTQYYKSKSIFMFSWFILNVVVLWCYYPGVYEHGRNGNLHVITQPESWNRKRQKWYVITSSSLMVVMVSALILYVRYVGRSWAIYSQVPYGLTRADQLGFRFFTSILGLIATVFCLGFLGRVGVAWKRQDLYADYDTLAQTAQFMNDVFGGILRSVFVMAQSIVFMIVLCLAFMSASYWGDNTGDIGYCIFENDVIRRTRMKRTGRDGSAAGGRGGGDDGAEGPSTSTLTPSLITHGKSTSSCLLVMERARWAANLGKEAYRCFDEGELAERPPEPPDRLVDLEQFDCELIALLAEPKENSRHDTHVIICRHRPTKRVCVCFRGTHSSRQMVTDIQTQYTKIRLDLMTTLKPYAHMVCNDSLPAYLRHNLPTNDERMKYNLSLGPLSVVASMMGWDPATDYKVGAHGVAQSAAKETRKKFNGNEWTATDAVDPTDADGGRGGGDGGSGGGRGGGMSPMHAQAEKSAGSAVSPTTEHMADLGVATVQQGVGAAHDVVNIAGHAVGIIREDVNVAMDVVTGGSLSDVKTRVHYGFYSSYCTLRQQIHEVVREELIKQPADLYIIGHSLGGALATHCALDMAIYMVPSVNRVVEKQRKLARQERKATKKAKMVEDGKGGGREEDDEDDEDDDDDDDEVSGSQNINLLMYTFGQPRVGFRRYMTAFNAAVPNAWRIVNDGDVVPTVPPFWAGFMHVGHLGLVDTRGGGSVLVDPTMLETHFKKKAGREVLAHLWPAYIKALDDCLDPIVDDDELLEKIHECYEAEALKRKQEGGCCYKCCCCCCIQYKKLRKKQTNIAGEEKLADDDGEAAIAQVEVEGEGEEVVALGLEEARA